MQKLTELCLHLLKEQKFDCLAVGVVDLEHGSYKTLEISKKEKISPTPKIYFDLASVTKPLTVGAAYLLKSEIFDENMLLLLNHQAGLPAWGRLTGRLSRENWRNQIWGYRIEKSPTLYSDFSALRLMLELEKKMNCSLKSLVSGFWDQELRSWLELPSEAVTPVTGIRQHKPICGAVHDDNAFIIKEFCAHAGLFSTVNGLCRSLINLERNHHLLRFMEGLYSGIVKDRYIGGWDRVEDSQNTLAGEGAGMRTFGHTGFTGTSVWIDLDRKLGHIILSNATRDNWYDRDGLNNLRRAIGKEIWKGIVKF